MASIDGMTLMPPAPPRSSASAPSMSQMLWFWRRPFTLMLALEAEADGGLLLGSDGTDAQAESRQ